MMMLWPKKIWNVVLKELWDGFQQEKWLKKSKSKGMPGRPSNWFEREKFTITFIVVVTLAFTKENLIHC